MMVQRRRLIGRALALLMGLTAGGVVALAVPNAAYAASCQTSAHVYFIRLGTYVKTEFDPIDGGTYDFHVPYSTNVSFQLGGNGLEPYTWPVWNVTNQNGTAITSLVANQVGGNCVSNQKSFAVSAGNGTEYTYRATYDKGTNDGNVAGQAHFRLIFDQAPPDPGGGGGGGGGDCLRICPLFE